MFDKKFFDTKKEHLKLLFRASGTSEVVVGIKI